MSKLETNINLIDWMEQITTVLSIPIILTYITSEEIRKNIVSGVFFGFFILLNGFVLWQLMKANRIEEKNLEFISKQESESSRNIDNTTNTDRGKKDEMDTSNKIRQYPAINTFKHSKAIKEIKRIILYNGEKNRIFIKIQANFKVKELFLEVNHSLYKSSSYLEKVGKNEFRFKLNEFLKEERIQEYPVEMTIKNFEAEEGETTKDVDLSKLIDFEEKIKK